MITTTHTINYKCNARFKGTADSPLLAPRGAYLHEKTLVVSDTGQNRVLIWNNWKNTAHQDATIILGQRSITETRPNAGGPATAATLHYPSGIWTDGQRLLVADAWNHRVLIWHTMPRSNAQPADTIIGQLDGSGDQPNAQRPGAACNAHTLYWPYGLYSDGQQLWIADTGNRRVLYYRNIPTNDFAPADEVIGQPSFTERDFNPDNAVWPYSIKIGGDGSLLIADTQCYRVLYWQHWRKAIAAPPDLIFGQPDLSATGQNQFRLQPAANTLNWVYDACFIDSAGSVGKSIEKNVGKSAGIAIADTGNSRILIHQTMPRHSNAPADTLIGQPGFDVNGESSLSLKNTRPNEMYWPFAVNATTTGILIADTGNHQILLYQSH